MSRGRRKGKDRELTLEEGGLSGGDELLFRVKRGDRVELAETGKALRKRNGINETGWRESGRKRRT